jgi:hypothetical protein
MSNKNHSRIGSVVSVAISGLILLFTGWIILNHQYVFDQWMVQNYQPPSVIASIVSRSGMSDKGRFFFYASQPAVESATDFNANCQRQEAKSAILGCYAGEKIHIYNVSNSQLDGIKEVTASHETLHAIWQRMSDNDKQAVGALLETEYVKLNDPALQERMAYYDRQEPGEHLNELHSIIGTEIANISPELEAHYALYFSNRSKVVALYNGYETIFNTQAAQSDALLAELATLKTELAADTEAYNTESASIEADYTALQARIGAVDRTSASEVNAYNAEVAALRVRLSDLSTKRAVIIAKQTTYNTKVTQYNALIISTNELTKSMDSTLSPTPSL